MRLRIHQLESRNIPSHVEKHCLRRVTVMERFSRRHSILILYSMYEIIRKPCHFSRSESVTLNYIAECQATH
jgi:hypothetical protein